MSTLQTTFPSFNSPSPKKTLVVMCGLPGSGKTTWRKELTTNHVISADTFIEYKASLEVTTYAEAWNKHKDAMEAKLLNQVHNALASDARLVVWDQTNLTRDKRFRIYGLFRDYNIYIADFTSVPIDVILERNEARKELKRDIPEEVLRLMQENMESPYGDFRDPSPLASNLRDIFDQGRVSIKVAENFYD